MIVPAICRTDLTDLFVYGSGISDRQPVSNWRLIGDHHDGINRSMCNCGQRDHLCHSIIAPDSFRKKLPTHQVNALLRSTGGYRNADYIKAGSSIKPIFLAITVLFFCFLH
jgi:hypothetical protein